MIKHAGRHQTSLRHIEILYPYLRVCVHVVVFLSVSIELLSDRQLHY